MRQLIEHCWTTDPDGRPQFAEILNVYFGETPQVKISWLWDSVSDRGEVEQLLASANANSWIIRGSSQPGCYSLSMFDISKR